MSYFVRVTEKVKGKYLQIYDSSWNKKLERNVSKLYETLGYEEDLKKKINVSDVVQHYKDKCKQLNDEAKLNKIEKISSNSSIINVGYFILKAMADKLELEPFIDSLSDDRKIKYDLYDLLKYLTYARVVKPSSKIDTCYNILPSLYEGKLFTKDQIYDGLDILGSIYQDIISAINYNLGKVHKVNMKYNYFDCTNFYFEIDLEDLFRKNGPSKEEKKLPLVGLALLLDGDLIPIGMELYPGNQSEKPFLPNIIEKAQKDLFCKENKTIEVADKGLNCEENIALALARNNGYLFSKSIKQMFPYRDKKPETNYKKSYEESLSWIFDEQGYINVYDENNNPIYKHKSIVSEYEYLHTCDDGTKKKIKLTEKRLITYNYDLAKKQQIELDKLKEKTKSLILSKAKRNEYGDCSKFVDFTVVNDDGEVLEEKVIASINEDKFNYYKSLAGYNLLITSEINLSDEEMYNIYHQLTNIERSFRIMKSQLEARPIYVSKENSIKGHFLTIYFALLLLRLIEVEYLKKNNELIDPKLIKKLNIESLISFISSLNYTSLQNNTYKNLSKKSDMNDLLCAKTDLLLDTLFIPKKQLDKIISFKIVNPRKTKKSTSF